MLRRWRMQAAAFALSLGMGLASADALERIASLNVCADQVLLTLVDRARIVALSPFATRPSMSYLADQAAGLPRLRGSAEEVIGVKADTVLIGAIGGEPTKAMLRAQGIRVIEVPYDTSIEGARATLRALGEALGVAERARALDSAIGAILAEPAPAPAIAILPLERRGWIEGGSTIYADLLRASGFENAGARLTRTEWGGIVPLESIVAARIPFALLAEPSTRLVDDQGAALLAHPALERLYPPDRRVLTPDALMACPVITIPQIVTFLRAEHARIIGRTSDRRR